MNRPDRGASGDRQSLPPPHAMDPTAPSSPADPAASRSRFRRTLIRVLAVQALTLAGFWLLQARYGL